MHERVAQGSSAGRTSAHPRLAESAQALDEHRRGQQGIVPIHQVVEELVVTRSTEVEEFFYSALFRPGVAPPTALKLQNPHLKVAQGGYLGSGSGCCALVHIGKPKAIPSEMWGFRGSPG